MTSTNGKAVGRPPDPKKVEALLDVAWQMFLQNGFEATSLETVAARSGVSRVTLYRHFPDKRALFRATIERETKKIEKAQARQTVVQSSSLAKQLEAFGVGLMTFLGSPVAVSFYSVLAGELRRHPETARLFYDLGPGRTIANLASILSAAQKRGDIKIASASRSAEMLLGIWQGLSNYRLALEIDVDDYQTSLIETVRAGISLFLNGCSNSPKRTTRRRSNKALTLLR